MRNPTTRWTGPLARLRSPRPVNVHVMPSEPPSKEAVTKSFPSHDESAAALQCCAEWEIVAHDLRIRYRPRRPPVAETLEATLPLARMAVEGKLK